MKLLLSSYSLEPFLLEEVFLLAKEIGADGLEVVLTPAVLKVGLGRIKTWSEKYQLPIYNIHQAPWQIFFAGRRTIKKLVNRAKFLGAQNIVMHLASLRRFRGSSIFDWIKKLEVESGINITFENAAPRILEKIPRYVFDPQQYENFVTAKGFNLTLDVSKAILLGVDPYQFFQRRRENIRVIHMHGFGENHFHLSFSGHNFDWFGFISFIKKYDFSGVVTLEIFPLHRWIYFKMPSQEQLTRAKEIIKENFAILKRA